MHQEQLLTLMPQIQIIFMVLVLPFNHLHIKFMLGKGLVKRSSYESI